LIEDNFPSAEVVCHSEAPNGEQLITLEIELHRFILPEFNTHRSFSRNFQSSRAVPIEKMILQVEETPALPVHWGKNQSGMVAEQESDSLVFTGTAGESGYTPEQWWKECAKSAAIHAWYMMIAGYHKQIVNRILEPFIRTKGVVTATLSAYEDFFRLRCHKDAQPEIKLLAERMQKAIAESKPNKLQYGEYHLPYVVNMYANREEAKVVGKKLPIKDAVKVSCSCAAQVSYRRLDDSLEKALKVYDMLNLPIDGVYPEDPPHFSPSEHIAKVAEATTNDRSSGNFHSKVFWQYRKALEIGVERKFLGEYNE
jgi:thymidylate synthase ThyX